MILIILLLVISAFILRDTREPTKLVEVKARYAKLREHLKKTDKFPNLHDMIPITAHTVASGGSVGYNMNKGDEIGLCIDGSINEIMHVLIHELAHSTVKNYAHDKKYWNKYNELKNEAISIGIYEEIPEKREFCGRHVQDK